jgi:hypothetical protein
VRRSLLQGICEGNNNNKKKVTTMKGEMKNRSISKFYKEVGNFIACIKQNKTKQNKTNKTR